jgi:exodeoxyribonuclease V alpha subunit
MDNPTLLQTVPGINSAKALGIQQAWAGVKARHEALVFLYAHGVKPAAADKIYRQYKQETILIVSTNPYQVADEIDGIGFLTADAIAQALGISGEHPMRVQAGLRYTLEQATKNGNCGLPEDKLVSVAADMLQLGDVVGEAVRAMVTEGSLIADKLPGVSGRAVFLPSLYRQESAIAEALLSRIGKKPTWAPDPMQIEIMVAEVERETGVTLAPEQKAAVHNALTQEISIVTGGPGTGKTTFVRTLTLILSRIGVEYALCAPTGRAATRLSEATGSQASTIHRMLGLGGGARSKDVTADLLVLDESSMLDVPLTSQVLAAAQPGSHTADDRVCLLFIGDKDQLPSVGPGKVLADMLDSGALPVTRLTHVFRQGPGSRITELAHEVNSGIKPDLKAGVIDRDFLFIEANDPVAVRAAILEASVTTLPDCGFGSESSQVIIPMRKGSTGVNEMGPALKQVLNPLASPEISKFGRPYALKDKVMQMCNDYTRNVFNGEIGVISEIDQNNESVTVQFTGRYVVYPYSELDSLCQAYTTTVHKFQGSEEQAVVLVLTTQHFPMLRRNLFYTGITRAKKMLILIGSRKAIAIAIATLDGSTRYTRLGAVLKEKHAALAWLGQRSA